VKHRKVVACLCDFGNGNRPLAESHCVHMELESAGCAGLNTGAGDSAGTGSPPAYSALIRILALSRWASGPISLFSMPIR